MTGKDTALLQWLDMATPASDIQIPEPFPIFTLAHRYLLYDVDVVTYIRRTYNICGVLIGGLPQAPQQNVFLGIPLELMPEEARLLVEKGVAYVVNDVRAHKAGFLGSNVKGGGLSVEERRAYQAALRKQGSAAARQADTKKGERKKAALKHKMETENWNDVPGDMLKQASRQQVKAEVDAVTPLSQTETNGVAEEDESLFASPTKAVPPDNSINGGSRATSTIGSAQQPPPYAVTPTTSYPPLQASPDDQPAHLPDTPASYPLFKHLHDSGYFMTPGLRFGCQYTAYPGDPLRYHSHFLCNGMDWEREFDLLDLVGGGRLGTGVKKGYLIGGEQREKGKDHVESGNGDDANGNVRAFCIEWGGM